MKEPGKTCASESNAAQAMNFDMMWLTVDYRRRYSPRIAANVGWYAGTATLQKRGRQSCGRGAWPWGRAGRMIEPRLGGGDCMRRRCKKDDVSRRLGYRSAGYEIRGRAPFTYSRIYARMAVVIPVIFRVDADQGGRGRYACVRVCLVAGLVRHAVV